MERLSRYGRRMRITLIKTMTVACFVCIIAIPFLSKKLLKTEANYYSITINGIKVGAANTEEEVIVALASARQELSAQYEEIVYMDPDIEIAKENQLIHGPFFRLKEIIRHLFQITLLHRVAGISLANQPL